MVVLIDALPVGVRICHECEGSGLVTDYRAEPKTCENCAWGDCDYEHPYQRMCWTCNGTGRTRDG